MLTRVVDAIFSFIARSIGKVILFLVLSLSSPAVNAMRLVDANRAVIVVFESHSRRRSRALNRITGYTYQFDSTYYV